MKKVLYILFAIIMIPALGGCAKIVNTETKVVEAAIIEVDRDPMIIAGKTCIPPDYDILLKYGDIETWVDVSRSEYYKYESLVGTNIEVNFIVEYYDDDSIKQYLALIE